jgi:hypothetical protein
VEERSYAFVNVVQLLDSLSSCEWRKGGFFAFGWQRHYVKMEIPVGFAKRKM